MSDRVVRMTVEFTDDEGERQVVVLEGDTLMASSLTAGGSPVTFFLGTPGRLAFLVAANMKFAIGEGVYAHALAALSNMMQEGTETQVFRQWTEATDNDD